MLAQLFNILAPVFICGVVGFVWVRAGKPFPQDDVNKLVVHIGMPALVFTTFLTSELKLGEAGVMILATITVIAAFAVVGGLILRLLNISLVTFLPAMMLPNAGYMGLPLSFLAFGDEGLALALAYYTVCVFTHWTVGISIAAGGARIGDLLRQPILWAVALSFVLLAVKNQVYDFAIPEWIMATTRLIGNFAIPLMLLSLGASIAGAHVESIRLSLGLSVLRVGLGVSLGVLVATLYGFEGAAFGVFVLVSSMPVAVFNFLFAQMFNNRPKDVASLVVTSTVLTYIFLPVLLPFIVG